MVSAVSSVGRCHDGCWYTHAEFQVWSRWNLHELGQGSPEGNVYPSGYPEAAPATGANLHGARTGAQTGR